MACLTTSKIWDKISKKYCKSAPLLLFYISLFHFNNAKMKRIFQTLIIISLLCGCQDRFPSMNLELSESAIECGNDGGEFEVEINGRPDWTTDNTAEWISIRKSAEGAVIIIDRNPGGKRSRTISFRLDGQTSAGIDIIQAHSDEFSIDRNEAAIGYKGGSVIIGITCHDIWEVSDDSEWISLDKTEGKGPQQLVLEVAPNPSDKERKGKVNISNKKKSLTVNILQAPKPVVDIEDEDVYFDGDGGQKDVLYMSNTDVNIICNESWIRLIEHGSSIKKVSFEVLRNLGDIRTGKIRIESADDRDIYKEITVSQGPKIDHPALSFKEGQELTLESKDPITIHPIFTDMTDLTLEWKSDNTEIAEVDSSGNVTIHKGGTCMIIAKNAYHGLEASISLRIMPKATSMTIMLGTQNMKDVSIAVRFPEEKFELSVIMDPADAYMGDIIYFSSDPTVGEIVGHTLHCLENGIATIYAESVYQGIRESFTLMVRE